MHRQTVSLVAAALLATVSPALAGDRVHASKSSTTSSQPATVSVPRAVSQQVTITIVPAPVQPAAEPVVIGIRGADGQVRRFPVEGGAAAIQSGQIVLRPGQSVTIHWTAAK